MLESISEIFNHADAEQQTKLAKRDAGLVEPTALRLLQAVYRSPEVPLPTRIKCAIAALPFESPKLIAQTLITNEEFGYLLDRAIERSNGARVINHRQREAEGD